jgi:hypothetical protein
VEARLAVTHTRTTQGEPVILDLREGGKLKNVSLEVKRFYFLEPTNFAKFHKWNRGLDMVVQLDLRISPRFYEKKFEMTLMLISGAWEKKIHEKKPEAKKAVTLSLQSLHSSETFLKIFKSTFRFLEPFQ